MPDSLDSFRLGLVNNRLPAIWGGWRHGDLLYKVSVMTVPDEKNGNFDLYKLEIQNPTDKAAASKLAAVLEGPPDMRLEDGVVRGLGDAPFLIADPPSEQALKLREWGLCDKRAKAYATGPGPGATEPAVASYRVGLDGVPVVYRVQGRAGPEVCGLPGLDAAHRRVIIWSTRSRRATWSMSIAWKAARRRRSITWSISRRRASRCASISTKPRTRTAMATSRFGQAWPPTRRSGRRG